MCHGHPRHHSCSHQSTGYQTPYPNVSFAVSQPLIASCPLANCDFRSAGGGEWTCCKCGGRNTSGWCSNMSRKPEWEKNPVTNEWEWIERCDHGCCRSCGKAGPANTSELDESGHPTGRLPSHRPGAPNSRSGFTPPAAEAVIQTSLPGSGREAENEAHRDSSTPSRK
ncbi:hypothetical protein MYCTH_2120909 [Thermothelomyces thermophilus ATCC 42464]|uniref:Uncharacterized protein n=1 Tax=Thermothelomyces thermophilus (strain ATCC 42464 / BCRC 31852 / DSM 1799) TaxID=573729 RepID=G2QM18_THET4|nr:uncharacterized protein MYCTH_2120909 [Thermothelomyces thermophilus ATCC 42464]AEO60998.1 hypothetical protein MYCTH_2120909 [Thermothelomyces thermophilus ATCC 42464]